MGDVRQFPGGGVTPHPTRLAGEAESAEVGVTVQCDVVLLDERVPETGVPASGPTWSEVLAGLLPRDRKVVWLCIGTDRSTGDALGPLIGMLLAEAGVANVYGTLSDPIHAANFMDRVPRIRRRHRGAFMVAIDGGLAKEAGMIGRIECRQGALIPGAGVNRPLKPVGDACVVAYVNQGEVLEWFVLQNTRLGLVWLMAREITDGILGALENHEKKAETLNGLPAGAAERS